MATGNSPPPSAGGGVGGGGSGGTSGLISGGVPPAISEPVLSWITNTEINAHPATIT